LSGPGPGAFLALTLSLPASPVLMDKLLGVEKRGMG